MLSCYSMGDAHQLPFMGTYHSRCRPSELISDQRPDWLADFAYRIDLTAWPFEQDERHTSPRGACLSLCPERSG